MLRGSTPRPANKSPEPAEYRGILDSPAGRVKQNKTARTSQRCVPVAGIIELSRAEKAPAAPERVSEMQDTPPCRQK